MKDNEKPNNQSDSNKPVDAGSSYITLNDPLKDKETKRKK